ncbi:Multidrug resistance protein MdtA [compost metagenome]
MNGLAVPIQAIFTDAKTDGDNSSSAQDAEKQKSKLNDKQVKQYIYLFDAKASTVKKAEVTTGIQNDQFIIVKTGIKAGQEIVSGPYSAIQNKLKDGLKVEKTAKDKLFTSESKK